MLVILIFIFSSIRFGETSKYSIREGEKVDMRCSFNFTDNKDIELQFEETFPFYKNGLLFKDFLNESQKERFDIKTTRLKHPLYQVQLIINNISRHDAGIYSCTIYDRGQYLSDESKSFKVVVEFPPGNASCNFTRIEKREGIFAKSDMIWRRLHCTAPTGSQQTYIVCYQNQEILPLTPTKNETAEVTKIWIKAYMPVHCCSFTQVHVRNMCDCVDFIWFPPNRFKGDKSFTPCPAQGDNERVATTEMKTVIEEESGGVECKQSTTGDPGNLACIDENTLLSILLPSIFFVLIINIMVSVTLVWYTRKKYTSEREMKLLNIEMDVKSNDQDESSQHVRRLLDDDDQSTPTTDMSNEPEERNISASEENQFERRVNPSTPQHVRKRPPALKYLDNTWHTN